MMSNLRDVYMLCVVLTSAFAAVVAQDSEKCESSDPPCYNYILTYVSDGGNAEFVFSNSSVNLAHHALSGRDMKAAIAEGKRALWWYKEKYGIDFTYVPESALFDGDKPVTSPDGAFTFHAWVLDSKARYRLVMASKGDDAQFFNTLISDGGWVVQVNRDYQANGRYRGLIPAGAYIIYGNYAIPVGCYKYGPDKYDRYNCNIFGTSVLVIHGESRSYFKPPVSGAGPIDTIVSHPAWGLGSGLMSITMSPDREPGIVSVLRFPGTLPQRELNATLP